MSTWTLESELCALANERDIASALVKLGLLSPSADVFEVRTGRDWYRSGAETYLLIFSVKQGASEYPCVMKACVAFGGGSLEEMFGRWLARRLLIDELGISTPRLFAVGGALVVEEYIPYDLFERLSGVHGADRLHLLASIGRAAANLVGAGFAPLSSHDWRSRGDDVVLIDYGEDLGPANIQQESEAGLLSEIVDQIARRNIELTTDELKSLGAQYEATLASI